MRFLDSVRAIHSLRHQYLNGGIDVITQLVLQVGHRICTIEAEVSTPLRFCFRRVGCPDTAYWIVIVHRFLRR